MKHLCKLGTLALLGISIQISSGATKEYFPYGLVLEGKCGLANAPITRAAAGIHPSKSITLEFKKSNNLLTSNKWKMSDGTSGTFTYEYNPDKRKLEMVFKKGSLPLSKKFFTLTKESYNPSSLAEGIVFVKSTSLGEYRDELKSVKPEPSMLNPTSFISLSALKYQVEASNAGLLYDSGSGLGYIILKAAPGQQTL